MIKSTQRNRKVQWGRRGITLAESVITIAILAALVALLLPGLNLLLEKSRSAKCLENLKQLGIGFGIYAADNNGALPPYRLFTKMPDGTEKRGEFWHTAISRSMELSARIQSCPTELKPFKSGHFYHYGMTASRILRISAVPQPSKRFLVGDSNGTARITTVATKVGSVITPADFEIRHHQKINLVFLDGHAESRRVEEIPFNDQKATPEYREFWTQ